MTVLDARAANVAADAAAENAALRRRLDEALAQQQAAAKILGIINAAPGDLAPVFEAILEKAMRLCEAAFGTLVTFDGRQFLAVAHRGVPDALTESLRAPQSPTQGGAFARLVQGEPVVHLADIADDDAYRSGLSGRVAMVDVGGARTAIWVALRKDETLRGALVIYRQQVRPFTDGQIALLQGFAAQAVIAMENARLLTETREALDRQTATAEILQVINASPGDLAPVFDAILEKALRLCGGAFGVFAVYEGERYRIVANRGLPPALAGFVKEPVAVEPGSMPDRLRAGEDTVQIADIAAIEPARRTPGLVAMIELGEARTALWVALRKDAATQGFFGVYRQEVRPFTDAQIVLLQNFAAQAVVAMENARLITETREALEQQTATAEVLQVINSSPGNLAPVFDAMLEKAMRLCEASGGALRSYDGEAFHAAAMRGVPTAFAEATQVIVPDPELALGRIARGAHVIQVADLTDPKLSPANTQRRREMLDLGGIRTALWVALRKDEILLGVFVLYRDRVQPFTGKQIALLQNFAAQAVIAMENARLLGELRQRTEEVAELNRGLEARVAEQVEELGRVGKLKRFLAPQLAELIVSQGDENILESHRREIVVVFCDLRGFTAFAETAEPEEVLELLREYHAALGPLVGAFEGTLDHFSGDGIMVFFNDPVPCPDPAERAVNMAVAMRAAAKALIAAWRRRGRELGFGIGIAQGYATLGQIGFADRSDYTAIGTVCNLAARLCGEAKDAQILLSRRVAAAVEESVALEEIGTLSLKGLTQPVSVFNVIDESAAS